MLVAKNTDGEVVWRSETISISGYTDVKVSADIRGDGPANMDGHLQLFYILDGNGIEIPWLNGLQRGRFAPTTAMADELNGSTLQLIIKARNTTDDDYYKIDNIRVYTESNDRYSIQDGDWNDPNTWSYTIGGPPCSCVPDKLSDTHIIDGYTVKATTALHTRNLTAHTNSRLQWISSNDLTLWGNAILDVKNQGTIERKNSNSIKFNQWNDEVLDITPDRVDDVCPGGNCPEVSVIINSDDPTGFQTYELAFNAKGTFTIQGNGNMQLLEDFDINHQARITNNLLGDINVGKHFKFHYPSIEVINHNNIIVNGNLWYRDDGSGELINHGSIVVKGKTNMNNNILTIDNRGLIEMADQVNSAEEGEVLFYNREGATWMFGGNNVDINVRLFAHYENNTVHYNGEADQVMLTPRDISDPTKGGSYWHLIVSNKNTDINDPESKKTFKQLGTNPPELDINGNLTIGNNPTGGVLLEMEDDRVMSVAGDWEQISPGNATFEEGSGQQTVIFDGTTDQYLRTEEHFNKLTIDKGDGRFITLNDIRTKDEVNFIDGIVEIDVGSIFTFEWSSTVGAVSNASHVQGGVRSRGDKDFTFPIGDGINYRPIGISELSTAFDITVEYFNATPPDAEQRPDEMVTFGLCGYWEMTSSDASATGKVTLHWDADCPVDVNEVAIARWNGTQWEAVPGTVTGDNNSGSVAANVASNEFGLFALTELTLAPVANDDPVITEEDALVNINVVDNDTDANGINPTSVVIVIQPQHGTLDLDPTTGIATYAPEADYNNDAATPDQFTYTVEDNKGIVSNQATVSITVTPVNDTPVATNDQDTINFATVLEAGSVLANDTDIEEDKLTASLVSGPGNGTLELRPDGSYTYTPHATFEGTDSFTYQTCDDGSPSACATASVTVTVRPFNYAPRAQTDSFTVAEDQTVEGNVLTNDTDINPQDVLKVAINSIYPAQHGAVVLQADGQFLYVPEVNFFGTDSLAYQVCDNGGPVLCDTAWVYVQVTPVNDAPVAVADEYTVSEGEEINEQVLTNDYDIEGSELIDVALVSSPMSGELILQADGSFTYTPHSGFVGEDEFVYRVCEAKDSMLCSQAVVRLQVEVGALAIPKGFSPNGDQVNDYWQIKGITGYPGSIVTIFNRWGNMVFQVMGYDNQNIVWTGESERGLRLGSNQLPEGTYFYVIDLGEGQKPMSGYVLLKR